MATGNTGRMAGAAKAARAVLAGVALAGVLGCTANGPTGHAPRGEDADRARRVEAGLRPAVTVAGLPESRFHLADRLDHLRVPGVSVAVVDGGEIAWASGYGVTTAGERSRVTRETLFQAASISKPVAALAALRLAEQGGLELDRPVNDQLRSWWLPDSPEWPAEAVTPRLLLAHGAGLSVSGFPGYRADAPLPGIRRILDGMPPANTEAVRLVQPPGAGWHYSGGGYTVLQVLMEDLTGEEFPELAERLVLAPLGMRNSTFRQSLPRRLDRRTARAHDATGAVIPGSRHIYPEMAAAGLWTTAVDLARFALGLQRSVAGESGAVLDTALARQMLRPQVGTWGLGLSLSATDGVPAFSHGGSNAGFRAYLFAYTLEGRGAVVMTNADQGYQLANEILRGIADEYGWPDYRPIPRTAMPLDAAAQAAAAGRYTIGDRLPAVITLHEDGLFLQVGAETPARLFAESEDVLFTLENLEIRLLRDEAGLVAALHGRQEHREWIAHRDS